MKKFDLEAFKAFVASKPADGEYDFYGHLEGRECPLSQFSLSVGINPGSDSWCQLHAAIDDELRNEPWTFGALASRLASLSDQSQ